MNAKWLKVAATMLKRASDEFANHGCNDWQWPAGWTKADKLELREAMHRANGDYAEWVKDGKPLHPPPDWWVMSFLGQKLIRELRMKRITVRKVVIAYKKSGLKSCRFVDDKRDESDAVIMRCPAMVLCDGNYKLLEIEYGRDYISGFTQGVDGDVLSSTATERHKVGYKDGKAAWDAVRPRRKRAQ